MLKFRHFKMVFVLFVVLILSSCASMTPNYEGPDLQVTNLKMLPLDGFNQRFRLSFRVVNPNNISFPVEGISFKFHLRGIQVASGVTNETFELKPLGESTFDVDVSTSVFNSGRVLLDIINAKPQQLAYEVDAKIFTSKGLWGSIPVTRSGVIPFGLKTSAGLDK